MSLSLNKLKRRTSAKVLTKPKKKIDRFDGLAEEEVQKYTLPDYLEMNLDIVFVGINPSLMAAHRGRYYAGPGNHFYKLLHESELTPRSVTFDEDYKLPRYGIGLTNIVSRPTRSSADLKRTELKEGSRIVRDKLLFYKPKIAVFNGKCIYEAFANKTNKSFFHFGLQPEHVGEAAIWVVPSSSARCANYPRMADKLHFYTALKKYMLFLKGEITEFDAHEFLFEGKCRQAVPRTSKMWRRKNVSAFLYGGRVANKDTVCLDTSEENVAAIRSTEFIINGTNDGRNCTDVDVSKEEDQERDHLFSIDPPNDRSDVQQFLTDVTSRHPNGNIDLRSESLDIPAEKKTRRARNRVAKPPSGAVATQKSTMASTDEDFVNLIKRKLLEKGKRECNSKEQNG